MGPIGPSGADVVSEVSPSIALNTTVVATGGDITVLLAGWEPGESVSVMVAGAVVAGGQANRFGALSLTATIDQSADVYSVVASGSESGATVSAPITVVTTK